MNVTGVQVKMFDKEKCIYEREVPQFVNNDLKMLLQNLRDVQSDINDVLTKLIQQRDISGDAQNTTDRATSSNIELDSSDKEQEEKETDREEEAVNPKKCKLSI